VAGPFWIRLMHLCRLGVDRHRVQAWPFTRRCGNPLPRAGAHFHCHPVMMYTSPKRIGETMFSQCVRLLIRLAVRSTSVIVILAVWSAPIFSSGLFMQNNNDKEITVWAIPSSKTYHCPGSRWYGKTEEGKYMSECEAIRTGFRPAFGRECGSECKH